MPRNFYNILKLIEIILDLLLVPHTWNNGIVEDWNVGFNNEFLHL